MKKVGSVLLAVLMITVLAVVVGAQFYFTGPRAPKVVMVEEPWWKPWAYLAALQAAWFIWHFYDRVRELEKGHKALEKEVARLRELVGTARAGDRQ